MELFDSSGNIFGIPGVTIIGPDGKPKTTGGGGGPPSGPAGGDLSGTYPNPSVVWANGVATYAASFYPLVGNPAGYLTAASLAPYLTIASAALTYYPLTNPSGYITSVALAPYLTSATAAATYYPLTNPSGYISGITALDVTTALGYTPYDATNPAGYITSAALAPYLTSATAALTYQPILSGTGIVKSTAGVISYLTDNTTNWDTAYTNRITSLTTTGSSGASTLIANTLNIPNYTLAGLGGVPTSRNITINGVTQDLSADRTWTIPATTVTGAIGITIDGGGSVITTGVKGYITVPNTRTITGWYIVGSPSGSIVVDVWKANASIPTVANTIAGTEKPTLTSSQYNSDLSLSSWTTALVAGDVIGFNVDSASSVTKVTITIVTTA